MKQSIKIFISSPDDVEIERQVALQVIQRLEKRYSNSCELQPVLWKHKPMPASGHFQDFLDPSEADIMICLFWSRLGSLLPEDFSGIDGRVGLTGSEWEFEHGLKAFLDHGRPVVLVYRKTADIMANIKDTAKTELALEQQTKLEAFFQKHFHYQDDSNTYKRALQKFEAIHEFESLLETHLIPLIEQILDSNLEHSIPISWHAGSPFMGLSAFEEKHQPVFFGRSRAVGELMAQYSHQVSRDYPFIMVSGMSGCGKSSLLNAGILHYVRTPRVVSTEVGFVLVIKIRPQSCQHERGPLMGLCRELSCGLPYAPDADVLYEQIKQSPLTLADTIRQTCDLLAQTHNLHRGVESRIQLVLDQAEELFTTESITRAHQVEFWAGVEALIVTKRIWFIGSIRSDFVGQGEGTRLYELMRGDGDYKLQPPERGELQQIIEKPAIVAGCRFESNEAGTSLATVILEDSQTQPGALPLVEFCLDELFRICVKEQRTEQGVERCTLTFQAYKSELGGLEGAISERAEGVANKLREQGVDVDFFLPKLFNALIQFNPDNIAQPATARSISTEAFADCQDLQVIVDALIAARLIVSNEQYMRFAHEALINNWYRVAQWLASDKEFQTFKAKIERDAHVWQQEHQSKARLLNKGKPLTDAQNWLMLRGEDLPENVCTFIKKSLANARRRQRQQQILFSIFGAVLIVLTAYSIQQQQHAQEQSVIAKAQTATAIKEKDSAMLMQSRYLADQATQKRQTGDFHLALLLSLNAMPGKYGKSSINDVRPYDVYAQESLDVAYYLLPTLRTYSHDYLVSHAEFSPDDETIIATSGLEASVWSLQTGKRLHKFEHEGEVNYAAFSPDGNSLVTASYDTTAKLWSTETGALLYEFKHSGLVYFAAFSPDGQSIITTTSDETAVLWSVETGEAIHRLDYSKMFQHESSVYSAVFSPDGKTLITLSSENFAALWSLQTGELLHRFEHERRINAVAFSPNGQTLVTASRDNSAVLWSTETGDSIHSIEHGGSVNQVVFNAVSNIVITASSDSTVAFWSVDSGTVLDILNFDTAVEHLVLSKDGGQLITALTGAKMQLWELSNSRLLYNYDYKSRIHDIAYSHDGENIIVALGNGNTDLLLNVGGTSLNQLEHDLDINHIEISSDSARIVTASDDGKAIVWSSTTGQVEHSFEHLKYVTFAGFSPDGRKVITTSWDKTAVLWSLDTGLPLQTFDHSSGVRYADFSPDGSNIVTASWDNTATLWDVGNGTRLFNFDHKSIVLYAQFSPDGSKVITTSMDKTAVLWSVNSGEMLHRITHEDTVKHAAFSSDGRLVATASSDRTAIVWSVEEKKILHRLKHGRKVDYVTFSPDGSVLIAISNNEAVLWSVENGQRLHVFHHEQSINHVAFNPVYNAIVTATDGGKAAIWSLDTGVLLYTFEEDYPLEYVAFSPDGDFVAIVLGNGTVSLEKNIKRISVEQAELKLPSNRSCLTSSERQVYFLSDLTHEQWYERGCSK